MEVHVVFRGMEHSDSIQAYALEKFQKVGAMLDPEQEPLVTGFKRGPVNVEIVFTAGHTHHHHGVELHIRAPHFSTVIKREGPDVKYMIEEVMDIALREINKYRERIIDSRKHHNNRPG